MRMEIPSFPSRGFGISLALFNAFTRVGIQSEYSISLTVDRTLNFLPPVRIERITKETRQEDRSTDASIRELTYVL